MEGTNNSEMNQPVERSSHTTWIWLAVGVAVLAGLAYFWNARSGGDGSNLESIETQSDSDQVIDIEADLKATDIDNIDYDLNAENYNAS